jgi:membrane protein
MRDRSVRAGPRPRVLEGVRPAGHALRRLASRVYDRIWNHDVIDRSASLSYYFVFALFPGLLFLTALFGLLPTENLMEELLAYAAQVLPSESVALIEGILHEVVRGANLRLLSFGVLASLWTASLGMVSVMSALNLALEVTDPRPWWKRRLIAIGLTVGFSLFTVTALVLFIVGPAIGEQVAGRFGLGWAFAQLWRLASWPVVILFVLTAVALVYYLAPSVRQRWRDIAPGAAFAVAGWLVVSFGFRLYVTHLADYNKTYGSIGGVILLLFWFYLNGFVLLVGAEINAERAHPASTVSPPAPAEQGGAGEPRVSPPA